MKLSKADQRVLLCAIQGYRTTRIRCWDRKGLVRGVNEQAQLTQMNRIIRELQANLDAEGRQAA